jgi:hypothetical protein
MLGQTARSRARERSRAEVDPITVVLELDLEPRAEGNLGLGLTAARAPAPAARSRRTAWGSVTAPGSRRGPAQRGQTRTSIANTRRRNVAGRLIRGRREHLLPRIGPVRQLHVRRTSNPVAFLSFGSQRGPGVTLGAYCSLTHSPRAESVKIGQREARPDEG